DAGLAPPAGASAAPSEGFGAPPPGGAPGAAGPPGMEGSANSTLVQYLQANRAGYKFLVAVPSSQSADAIILATGEPVMALGGFSGSDPILTVAQLQQDIANGTVRYFQIGRMVGPGGGSDLTAWII